MPEYLPLWSAANGGQLLSEDGTEAELNSAENVEASRVRGVAGGRPGWLARFNSFRDTWDFFGDNNQLVSDQIGTMTATDTWVTAAEASKADREKWREVLGDVDCQRGGRRQGFLRRL